MCTNMCTVNSLFYTKSMLHRTKCNKLRLFFRNTKLFIFHSLTKTFLNGIILHIFQMWYVNTGEYFAEVPVWSWALWYLLRGHFNFPNSIRRCVELLWSKFGKFDLVTPIRVFSTLYKVDGNGNFVFKGFNNSKKKLPGRAPLEVTFFCCC